jgi:hypothetical protein
MSWTRTLHDFPEGAAVIGWMMEVGSDGKNDNKQEQQAIPAKKSSSNKQEQLEEECNEKEDKDGSR